MALRMTRSINGRKLSSTSSVPSRPKTATSKPHALSSQDLRGLAASSPVDGAPDVWCTCKQPDDGKPMISCESCADWFHFSCIQLSERDAEDIRVYICNACHNKTKLLTVYEWEGPETIHTVRRVLDGGNRDTKTATSDRRTRSASAIPPDSPDEDDDDDVASEDDYKEEADNGKGRRKGANRITSSDEDDENNDDKHDDHDEPPFSRNSRLKRKRVGKGTQQQRKRPRKSVTPETSDNEEIEGRPRIRRSSPRISDSALDATRRYCLAKLQDVLTPMFLEFARHTAEDDPTKDVSELIEEGRRIMEEKANTYSQELERCLYDVYGEIDKNGHKLAVGKYKDRFRMLTFNLSQKDRYDLRKSIGTNSLPAIELSKMSSVDLANEQIKQKIEAANRESLQHSILTERPTLPRAKITHKGEEIIEDIEGFDIGKRFREEELLEREIEREKAIRERAAKAIAISPVSPVGSSFGPQDILAQQHTAASQMARALAEQTASLAQSTTRVDTPTEPSFRLDDLIAMELPDSPSQGSVELPVTSETAIIDKSLDENPAVKSQPGRQETMSPTAAFDLKTVWSVNEKETQESSGSPVVLTRTDVGNDLPQVDIDLGTATLDEDFDMFLAETEQLPATVHDEPDHEAIAFEKMPIVWNGSILMPDSEQCPEVNARQVGGKPIDSSSSQWNILFPTASRQLRIEGRVSINDSAKYITQNRLNVSRELIVVAFTPSDERKGYDELLSNLINRGRHAVIHPWGLRPGPDAPGKELYLVPIISNQQPPDYVELLDLVEFPKQSDQNRLLGVFIMNKGKFTVTTHSQPLQPLLGPPQPPTIPRLLTDLVSTLPPPMPSIPSTIPTVNQASPDSPLNSDLVSKLSSEQIESLLQTVLASNNSALSTLPVSALTVPVAYTPLPPAIANLLQSHHPPVQNHPSASYPYPPMQQGLDHPSPYAFGSHGDPSTLGREKDKPLYGGGYNDRRESVRGRSRGFEKTRDSGWAGRARGRGRGNGSHA